MKKIFLLLTGAALVTLCSCASTQPQAFHNTDATALIVQSLDSHSCQVVAPTPIAKLDTTQVFNQARTLSRHQTAVVILENYSEPVIGPQFHDRTFPWFIGLRGLGYQNILFLQGRGVANADGLPILAAYN